MHKRLHSREFKLDVVRQIASGQKRPAQACREYGLADSVLSRWRKEYQERGEAAFLSQSGESTTQEHRIAERHLLSEQASQQHPELSIERLCELFDVSRSWYYERGSQPESDARETALRDEIERIMLEFSGYGYRRVTHALSRQGWRVNHKHVLRIMREESLLCHLKKRFVVTTTNSRHGLPIYPNILADFSVTAPDQAGWRI